MPDNCNKLNRRIAQAGRLWLFLDYDGTLADFAPTPEYVEPHPEVVDILTTLSHRPELRIAVVSGRRLRHVQALLPVPGLLLAGTYGLELQTPSGQRIERLSYDRIRPVLESLKPRWQALLAGQEGFFLEDKGWSLALHARFANELAAGKVLRAAHSLALEAASGEMFRLLGGHRFLEVGPKLAHKGRAVEYLLEKYPWPGSLSLYLGDDDKDEEAFEVIKARGGLTILVAQHPRPAKADCRLESPRAVRSWLKALPGVWSS
ncbi:MAG: trehalose-phosphatase [Anaerolineae bacterium]|nr:trehalose-phosphatase [Anaerolineae bacterium]